MLQLAIDGGYLAHRQWPYHCPMNPFGEELRRERILRQVTLEEIAAATRIQPRFLQALEEGNTAALPGGHFVRSFVRAYARHLGLDEERTLAHYLAAEPVVTVAAPAPPPTGNSPWSGGQALMTLLVLGVIALSADAGYHMIFRPPQPAVRAAAPTRRQPKPQASSSPARSAAVPQVTPTAAHSQTGQRTAPVSLAKTAVAAAKVPTVAAASHAAFKAASKATSATASKPAYLVQLSVSAPAWVSVEVDHNTALQTTLQKGAPHTFKALHEFRLITGNAGATRLLINGHRVAVPGGTGVVGRVQFPAPASEASH